MPQYARPTADLTVGAFTASAGALWSCVDEAVADDLDFITSSAASDSCLLATSDPVDPGTDSGFVLRVRAKRSNLNGALTAYLNQGPGTNIATQAFTFGADNTYTTQAFALSAVAVANITDFTDLRFAFAVGNTLSQVWVSWVELEVPDVPAVAGLLGPIRPGRGLWQPGVYGVS